jgi:hypothetical protein
MEWVVIISLNITSIKEGIQEWKKNEKTFCGMTRVTLGPIY